MRRFAAAICLALALLPACSRTGPPNSLFESAGYHVRGDAVYYLNAFPGKAFVIEGADAATFHAWDRTYARDADTVFLDGVPLDGADPATFELLDRPGFAKDARHVFMRERVLSDDPAHFELLDANLSRDGSHVYWSDGAVLSDDPAHFELVSNIDHYTFTRDASTVHVNGTPIVGADAATFRVLRGAYARDEREAFYFTDAMPGADPASLEVVEGPYARDSASAYWMGKVIPGADPATFVVLNGDFECTADATRAFYRNVEIAGSDPGSFPTGKAVTNCSENWITFAE